VQIKQKVVRIGDHQWLNVYSLRLTEGFTKTQTGKTVNSASSISQQTEGCFLHTRVAEHLNIPDQKGRQSCVETQCVKMQEKLECNVKGTHIWYCSANVVCFFFYWVKTFYMKWTNKYTANTRHAITHGAWSKINSISQRIKIFTAFTTGSSNTSCISVQKIEDTFRTQTSFTVMFAKHTCLHQDTCSCVHKENGETCVPLD